MKRAARHKLNGHRSVAANTGSTIRLAVLPVHGRGLQPAKTQNVVPDKPEIADRDKSSEQAQALQQLQRRLCGPRELRMGRLDVACDIFPVAAVSGDFYSATANGHSLNLVAGDIAGKGLEAGFWFTFLLGLAREHALLSSAPGDSVQRMHRSLFRMRPDAPLAALFFAQIDSRSGHLRYTNAGMPPALVLRADNSIVELTTGGTMLGALPDAQFLTGEITLRSGDSLLIFSDGILENRDARDNEFGANRLLAAARAAGSGSARDLLYSVFGAAQDFAGLHPRHDDFSLIAVRCLEGKLRN